MRRLLLLIVPLLLALPLGTETTRFWRQQKYEEFDRGRARGIALRSDGELLLAPRFGERADASLEFLWAVVQDTAGNLYVGGGSPAKVIRIDPVGQTSTFFESKELEVHALAFDATGNLIVVTSPDGKIHKVSATGEAREFFNPERKYIWDIALDAAGNLFVATGDKGEIFRVAPDGTGKLFFSSAETHVRVLAWDATGNLLAGTEPNGRIIRIGPAGDGFVMYETSRKEVTALIYDVQGNLFAAAIGRKFPPPTVPTVPPPPSRPTRSVTTVVTPQTVTTQVTRPPSTPIVPTARLRLPTAGGSAIYRIAPDGYPHEWWSSENELVYALGFDKNGTLLAGTGNEGKLLAIDSSALFTNLVKSSSGQLTRLLRAPDGTVFAVAANPGKVYALGPELKTEGSFESDVFDTKLFSTWGRIRWQSRSNPAPLSGVKLYTRSGNTSDPEKNWSPWSAAYTNPDGEPITSPPARFLQWKVVLTAGPAERAAPSLASVSVAYLRRNVAPVVEEIIVQAPGVRVRGAQRVAQQVAPAKLELPPSRAKQLPKSARGTPAQKPGQRVEPPPQGVTEKGARSVVWSAQDANDDELEFTLYYRGEGESRWKLFKDKLKQKFYTWDAATLPDGAYHLKVVASDAPANPPERALIGEKTSNRFEIDNTPPRVEELIAQTRSRSVEIRFLARDTFSPIQKANYSLDAGPWRQLFPITGATDAPIESYRVKLGELEPGEHTVVIRIYDQFENAGLAKVTFSVK
ncbi:MAG: hypothetical protein ACE5H2_01870 [Terriglobia bacterium]